MYNIMIVDDEPVLRKGLLSFVDWESLGCKVVCEASDGVDAKQKLNCGNIDIVITDIKMPCMDGIELSKYIYENFPGIKVIILTAFADFSYAQSAIKYNVVDFVIKTNPTEKIPEAVIKAKKLIIHQREKEDNLKQLESKLSNSMSEISENFFKDIINGIVIDKDIINSKTKEYSIILDNYFVVAYEVNSVSCRTALQYRVEKQVKICLK